MDARWSALHMGLTAILLSVYAAALIAIPTGIGFDLGFAVLSPARIALCLAGLAAILEFRKSNVSGWIRPVLHHGLAWAVFLGAAGISTALNPSSPGLSRLASLVIEGAGVFYLSFLVCRRAADRRRLTLVILGTTIIVAGATIALAALDLRYEAVIARVVTGQADVSVPMRFGLGRQQGSFDSPLFFALWLLASSGLIVGFAEAAPRRHRWVWIVGWIIVAIAIGTTLSRIAIVGVWFALAGYLAGRSMWRKSLVPGAIGFALALALVYLPTTGLNGISIFGIGSTTAVPGASAPAPDPYAEIEGSNSARMEVVSVAVRAVQKRPLFGSGLLTAKSIAAGELGRSNAVDNSYLAVLIELGIAGLISLGVLLLMTLRRAIAADRSDPYSVAGVIVMIALLVGAGFAATLTTTQGYSVFWLVAGVVVADRARAGRPGQATSLT